jgi:polyhydroxyalkanoate synthesis regulator phasin
MNSIDPVQFLQKGIHITLGAATSMVESLQDAQKRQENLNQLRLDPNQFTESLADKGKTTEQDARTLVEQLWSQRGDSAQTPPSPNSAVNSTAQRFQQELAELTQQIADIRNQLEQARQNKGG